MLVGTISFHAAWYLQTSSANGDTESKAPYSAVKKNTKNKTEGVFHPPVAAACGSKALFRHTHVCHMGIAVRIGWNQCGRFDWHYALLAPTGTHLRDWKKKKLKEKKSILEKLFQQMYQKANRHWNWSWSSMVLATTMVMNTYLQIAFAFFTAEWFNELSSL